MACPRAALLLLLSAVPSALALDNGEARTPPMGFNSWTAFGPGVTEADLRATADFFVSSGLAAAGYAYVNSDDGFSLYARDNATGRIVADPAKFPSGIAALAAYIHGKGLKFGIYSASSSVVCSGRPGSLYNEALDADTFVNQWGVDYIKLDLCGEYAFGNQARLAAFGDALNSTGRAVVLSTEPYDIVPDPSAADFSNVWRCCSDIDARWETIVDRIDRNDVLAPLVGPGHWSDADMLQIGNGALTFAEQRAHFALWAVTKNPLLLATDVTRLSAAQIALVTNAGLIAINQDALGVPARKVSVNGAAPLRHVGLAPCENAANAGPRANLPGGAALLWDLRPLAPVNGTPAFAVYNRLAERCLALAPYAGAAARPVLQPCSAADATQAWALPGGLGRLGALLALGAAAAAGGGAAQALSPANSTIYGSVHGSDPLAVQDAAYGLTNLGLVNFAPPAPCDSRDCSDYSPTQTWHYSPRSGLIALAVLSANHYHCFDPPCELTTAVVPTSAALCLAHVWSVAYEGTDPSGTSLADVWAGPLAGGEWSLTLHNRASSAANVTASWALLGVDPARELCVRDELSGATEGPVAGGVSRALDAHDVAPLRVWAPPCGW